MKIWIAVILAITLSPLDAVSQSETNDITTFILVRHAEKADESEDPELSTEGVERSDLLARMLSEVEFDAVYSTPYIRTTETVLRIADQNQIEINEYESDDPESLAGALIEMHKSEFVLIAGHSNTLPQLANALLGRMEFSENLDESDYENILIVTITSGGAANLLHMKF